MDLETKERILKELEGKVKNPRILQLNDTAKFGCNLCGECCKNREDIMLSISDLRNIISYLNTDIIKFIGEYCEIHTGENSKIPIMILSYKWSDGELICPFLRKRSEKEFICGIDEVKPNVCRMFPVAKVTVANMDNSKNKKTETVYVASDMDCVPESYLKDYKIGDWIREDLQIRNDKWSKAFMWKLNYLEDTFKLRSDYDKLNECLGGYGSEMNKILDITKLMFMYDTNTNLEEDEAIEEYLNLESSDNKSLLNNLDLIVKIAAKDREENE